MLLTVRGERLVVLGGITGERVELASFGPSDAVELGAYLNEHCEDIVVACAVARHTVLHYLLRTVARKLAG